MLQILRPRELGFTVGRIFLPFEKLQTTPSSSSLPVLLYTKHIHTRVLSHLFPPFLLPPPSHALSVRREKPPLTPGKEVLQSSAGIIKHYNHSFCHPLTFLCTD